MNHQPESATSPSSDLTLLDSEPGAFAFFAWKNLTIIIWYRQATGAATERLKTITELMVNAHPEGISNVHLVANGAGLPTPEARQGFVDLMERHAKSLVCVCTVFEGGGFWASALRSVTTGMRMVAPRTFAWRINSDIEEVANWIPDEHLKRTGVRLNRRQFASVLKDARAHQEPRTH